MRKLKAESRVLGLNPGDTFESDDEFYDPFIKGNHLSVVEEKPSEPPEVTPPAPATPRGRKAAAAAPEKPEEPVTPVVENGAEA
jgi:hypothetical protein